MAYRIENQCVGCPPNMGCLGSACPNRNVKIRYCDKCGADNTDIYYDTEENEDICWDCLMERYKIYD